jgi:Transposase DDE domain
MFLRHTTRKKDGKEHRYWSVVENRRLRGGSSVQKVLLYLGEINDSQHAGWCKAIDALDGDKPVQMFLYPADRQPPKEISPVQIRMDKLILRRPRQWGACWLTLELWKKLQLDEFWAARLPTSREGTRWLNVLKTLVTYRLLDPGSEFRLHRLWYDCTAMADLLGEDFRPAAKENLYRCLDKLLEHKNALFGQLVPRWKDLFGARFDVLLYDLTSTYFEIDPPDPATSKKRYGYSRDKRPDCVQVVIALIVTPVGFPLAYEVLPGNTQDRSTLRDFLKRIEAQYGKADRIWVMDRGVPTEETIQEMQASTPPVQYLVGTPKALLNRFEEAFLKSEWQQVREKLDVKLIKDRGETYVLTRSGDRIQKERAMRRRKLTRLWRRLKELAAMKNQSQEKLLMRLGAAKQDAGLTWRLVEVQSAPFAFRLNREALRVARRREGRYLLRTNLACQDPAELWRMYMRLSEVEQAFKELKNDLGLRPIHHQLEHRIEAHIFVAFMAYCLQVTLKQLLRSHAGGLTPPRVMEQMAGIQMLDVIAPTTTGQWLSMSRYTQPDKTQQLLLLLLGMNLPPQPPPKITKDMPVAPP